MENILSPQEKAKELVEKMMLYSYEKKEYDDSSTQYIIDYKIKKEYAKQCALMAVDEILNNDNQFMQTQLQYEYWQEVKQEIEKL